MEKKKCYISLPISGRDMYSVRHEIRLMEDTLRAGDYEPYAPIIDETVPYSELMGKDIAMLLECDAVIFLRGWQNSNGCMLEFAAAKIYGKQIIIEMIVRKEAQRCLVEWVDIGNFAHINRQWT